MTTDVKQTNRLRELMQFHNISQTDLAQKLGQSRINFNKIVNNKRTLDIPTAKKIAKIFDRKWFEIYEPINTTVAINGYVNFTKSPYVEFADPLEARQEKVTLMSYLSEPEELICIKDNTIGFVWLMCKSDKSDKLTQGGLYFVKDGTKYHFIRYRLETEKHKPYAWVFHPGQEDKYKKINTEKKKFDFVIPVTRIDNWFKYVQDNNQ